MADTPLHGLDPRDLIREGFSALRDGGGVPWVPPRAEELAPEFERYEILRLAGRGGMGAVYEARHRKLGKRVAVKLLPPECGLDPKSSQRFEAEGKLLASLHHPGVVSVYDSGETKSGSPYIVMEYVEGEDLAARMKRGRLPPTESLAIINAVGEALAAAHAQGILHRDLKPSNVLLGADGRVRVADFGLAMVAGVQGDLLDEDRSPGQGTEAYAAPEQLSGIATPEPCADIYSLGVLAYELLTGSLPPGELSGPMRAAGVDARYDAPLLRALQSDPAHRTGSVSVFLQEVGEASTAAHREAQTRRRLRRTRRLVAAMAALVAVASTMALVSWQRGKTIALQRGDLARLEIAARVNSAKTDFSLANLHAAEGPALWPVAIAHLSRAMRLDPDNNLFGQRMFSLLSSYGWPEPIGNALHHAGAVRYAIFSPDGTKVATASDDGTARLWDAVTPQPVGEVMKHTKAVLRVEFSPDGKWMATASDDGTARVWDATSGAAVTPPLRHRAKVRSARFDKTGRKLVTASEDHTAQVWDVATGQRVGTALTHGDEVTSACFSPDGGRVLTTSTDCRMRLWDSDTGKLITESHASLHWFLAASFSSDGSLILVTLDGGIAEVWRVNPDNSWNMVWDLRRQGDAPPGHQNTEVPSILSPDGLWLASNGGVWRLQHPPPFFHSELWRHRKQLTTLAFGSDNRTLLSASLDGTAVLWDVPRKVMHCMPMRHVGEVSHAAMSPDGTRIVTASTDGTCQIWSPHQAVEQSRSLPSPRSSEVWGVAASLDGRYLATGSNAPDGDVILWNTATLIPMEPVWKTGFHVFTVEFSPDSKRILATRRYQDSQIWDIASQRVVRTLSHPGHRNRTARFSPDGHFVATGGDYAAIVWDLQAPESAPPLILKQPDDIHGVAWMPDSRRLVTACGDGRVQMWDATTGKALPFSVHHALDALACDVSPDGRWIATGSLDWTARVWDAATGRPVSEPMEHTAGVRNVRFSPDGRRVVTACESGEVIVWDALTGHALRDPLRRPGEGISAIFFSDGRRILSGGKSGEAHIWDLGPDPNAPAPVWLPDAAEKLAGMKLDSQGRLTPYSNGWRELVQQWQHNDAQDPYASLFRAILKPSGP